jgi:hypothetical protein
MARKVSKRDYGQAKAAPARPQASTWTPFAEQPKRKPVSDDTEYEAFDRVRGGWFKHTPKGK